MKNTRADFSCNNPEMMHLRHKIKLILLSQTVVENSAVHTKLMPPTLYLIPALFQSRAPINMII